MRKSPRPRGAGGRTGSRQTSWKMLLRRGKVLLPELRGQLV